MESNLLWTSQSLDRHSLTTSIRIIDICVAAQPQICTRDPRICAILIPARGSNCGSLGFSNNQNNRGSSGAYVTCSLSVKTNTRKTLQLFCVCSCMWSANPKTPELSPMADDAIPRGGIGGLGSLVYICGLN